MTLMPHHCWNTASTTPSTSTFAHLGFEQIGETHVLDFFAASVELISAIAAAP
jgi:hypothetical protein